MTIDFYTKAVLTTIAIALSALAIQSGIGSARALGDGCGSYLDPCIVEIKGGVRLSN